MGIRPQILFGVGLKVERSVEDYTPVGWPQDWEETPIPMPVEEEGDDVGLRIRDTNIRAHFLTGSGEPRKVGDFVRYDGEYGDRDWAIYVVDESPYNDDFLWALGAVYDEMHSRFVEIPLIPPEENHSTTAQWWKVAQRDGLSLVPYPLMVEHYQRQLDNRHNYAVFGDYIEQYLDLARWVFGRGLGLQIEDKDLRLGIMWLWS